MPRTNPGPNLKPKTLLLPGLVLGVVAVGLSACGGGSSPASNDNPAPNALTLGGAIKGLGAAQSVILANGSNTVTVNQNGNFQFPGTLPVNSSYAVTVAQQPTGQTCTVNNATGAGITANVSNLDVSCSNITYRIGGSLTGLASGAAVSLSNNGSDTLAVSANGAFTFDAPINHDGSYVVTVSQQPTGQTCTVGNGTGTGVTRDVSNVAVTCQAQTFGVSGTVSGLKAGTQLTLMDNGADPVVVSSNGSFSFSTPINYGGSYSVTVNQQPTGQTCTVAQGAGSNVQAAVSNVSVSCSPSSYTIGGAVSGLSAGAQVTLYNNGGDAKVVNANGGFTFTAPVSSTNGAYSVTVNQQPVGQNCTVSNGSGTAAANVTNVSVACIDAQIVSTLAGSGAYGSVDGQGTAASFSMPFDVAVDRSGNVYVADYSGNTIRKILPTGLVTTLAGSGASGSTNGTGTAASFSRPAAVAVDGSGNVYVADAGDNTIRKITPAGEVTTLAGSGVRGSANGTGTAASFSEPFGVAVDGSGNVYVGEYGNNAIRKITPAGEVTTLAGSGGAGAADGMGTAASFNGPQGVAVDGSGNVYVADIGNHKIRKITPAGEVTTLAGSGGSGAADGMGTAASFYYPRGVAVDGSGNVYVGDTFNKKIRKITPAGWVTTLAGSGVSGSANGTGTAASFNGPWGVEVDGSGNVYVADSGNNMIRKISQP